MTEDTDINNPYETPEISEYPEDQKEQSESSWGSVGESGKEETPKEPLSDAPHDAFKDAPQELKEPAILPSPLDTPDLPPPHEEVKPTTLKTPVVKKKKRAWSTPLLFVILFIIGIWLSSALRAFVPLSGSASPQTSKPSETPTPSAVVPSLSPVVTASVSGTVRVSPSPLLSQTPQPTLASNGTWHVYNVLGLSKQPVNGFTFGLPPQVLAPLCDSAGCNTQGTYLPGGTRFTVAARGRGQLNPDVRGAILTDVSGRSFDSKEASIAGKQAVEYSGNFTGTTTGGYTFTKMHGYMIYASDTLTIEMSHFAPAGVNADFDNDEVLFQKILGTITY